MKENQLNHTMSEKKEKNRRFVVQFENERKKIKKTI